MFNQSIDNRPQAAHVRTQASSPRELIERIKKTWAATQESESENLERYRQLGEMLSYAKKELCTHGTFESWAEGHFDFTKMSASRYMRLYYYWDQLKVHHGMSLAQAMFDIKQLKDVNKEEKLKDNKANRATKEKPAARDKKGGAAKKGQGSKSKSALSPDTGDPKQDKISPKQLQDLITLFKSMDKSAYQLVLDTLRGAIPSFRICFASYLIDLNNNKSY